MVGILLLHHGGKGALPSTTKVAPTGQKAGQQPSNAASPTQPAPVVSVPNREAVREDKFSPSDGRDLYKHISPSVVWIDTYNRGGRPVAQASGFLVSRDGRVATNLHVIEGADEATVRFDDGRTVPVRSVVRIDHKHDLAVLDIGGAGYDCIRLSTGLPEVGARVYAIGNPQGLAGTLSGPFHK